MGWDFGMEQPFLFVDFSGTRYLLVSSICFLGDICLRIRGTRGMIHHHEANHHVRENIFGTFPKNLMQIQVCGKHMTH